MSFSYQAGFGNTFETEAVSGALPRSQNSPQKPAFGLYAEQLSGTAFTAPRHENRRSWLYRLRPSAQQPAFVKTDHPRLTGSFSGLEGTPNRLRWDPPELPTGLRNFLGGLVTYCGAGDPAEARGLAVHLYCASESTPYVFASADGEMLIVPQEGTLVLATEMGRLEVAPGEIGVIPRGVRFRVEVQGPVRGYVCENYGAPFRLPERGPIGANGLADERDFLAPVAWFEDVEAPTQLVVKAHGQIWTTTLDRSPLDVVAWHGSLYPYKYDLARFSVIGTVSFDHPDPSIFTVLTSPSDTPGVANADFVIFPPRWQVAEHTFRPPYFHRNVMSEFMGLIRGAYDAKAGGFAPGGASLHPQMSAHGPDLDSWKAASEAVLAPVKLEDSLAFMFESRWPLKATPAALALPGLQADYDACWSGFPKASL